MEYITLNSYGFADVSGFIKCYQANPEGEFIGERDEFIPATTGLPANAFIDSVPIAEDGKTIVRANGLWGLIDDHRGKDVYSTESGVKSVIDYIGPVREGFTLLAPVTPYDKWNGSEWETDTKAQHAADLAESEQQKTALLAEATAIIAPLADAQAGGYIDDADVPHLTEWQRYRYKLTKVDTSTAPDITLPLKPEV